MGRLTFDFTDRTVVVTGGARGIGLELVKFFRASAAEVVAVDVDGDALRAVSTDTGAIPVVADPSLPGGAETIVTAALEGTGRLDIVVNNAGILRDAVVWKLTDDDWDRVLAVHTGSTFRMTRASVPHFRERGYGRIVNVTSYTGLHGNIGQSNYATAKAGIIGFTKTTAKELARFGVTVNAVSPNAETRMIASIPAEKKTELTAGIPIGRFADPSEICPAVGFLASKDAGYITGVVLPVDGGLSM